MLTVKISSDSIAVESRAAQPQPHQMFPVMYVVSSVTSTSFCL